MTFGAVCLILAGLAAALPVGGHAACRQALAMGLDVSASVNEAEYRLQLDGLAGALSSDEVREIILNGADAPIRLAIYEWSGAQEQILILDWTEIGDAATLDQVSGILRDHRRYAGLGQGTAIGAAILSGFTLLDRQADCPKRTLDLSGDGPNNSGTPPEDIAATQTPLGVTVNGLVIGADNQNTTDQREVDIKQLSSYYRTRVIRGPGAFVETALGFEDYRAAMTRKLLRELQGIVVGDAARLAPPT